MTASRSYLAGFDPLGAKHPFNAAHFGMQPHLHRGRGLKCLVEVLNLRATRHIFAVTITSLFAPAGLKQGR